jgi:hypothetical protein
MAGRNMNIYFQEENYQMIREISSKGGVSGLVNEIVSEYISELKKKEAEELRNKMISGYKMNAIDLKLKKELESIENSSINDVF